MTDQADGSGLRLRVGVVPAPDPRAGGIYQYGLAIVAALSQVRPASPPIVFLPDDAPDPEAYRWIGGTVCSVARPTLRRSVRRLLGRLLGERRATALIAVVRRHQETEPDTGSAPFAPQPEVGEWMQSQGASWAFYTVPVPLSLQAGIRYVVAVHDLQHRLQPEFPEVSADGELEYRERLIGGSIAGALLVVVDSDVGREDVLAEYGDLIDPERVKVLPFVPPPYLAAKPTDEVISEVRQRFGLPSRYLLFPAQFWPHKNHLRVVQALGALRRDHGVDVPVVMCGSAEGPLRSETLRHVVAEASSQGVADLVSILGYVSDDDIAALYHASAGVVLPTFFGPTNIPVVEGWAVGVPVLTSDIRGIREQCGDAALLVDPRSVEAIANGIATLWLDGERTRRLVHAGRERLASYDDVEFRRRVADIVEHADRLVGGHPQ